MNTPLKDKTIAILATHGFEQSELFEPLKAMKDAGAHVILCRWKKAPYAAGIKTNGVNP
jgi:protease I